MAYSFPGGSRLLAVCAALMLAGGAAVGQTDYFWQVGGGGGSYDDPGAWNPAGPPDPNGRAVFDLGGFYDVTFANDHTINTLSVEQGYVGFYLDGYTYELTRPWDQNEHGSALIGAQPGMTGLTVYDGTVVSAEFTVARGGGSEADLTVELGGRWTAFGHFMALGDQGGIGTLSIYDGGVVEHGHGFAGWRSAASIGGIDVEGVDSTWWVTGWFGLGVEGTGQLDVRNDGLAKIGKCEMGGVAGSYGSASIEDFGELHLTGAMETSLVVGLGGEGEVYLQYDGLLTNDGNMCIAEQTGSNGNVYVQETSRLNNAFELIVGGDGNGMLLVDTGSIVQTGSCSIAPNAGGQGAVTVDGAASRLSSTGPLSVGGTPAAPGGTGRLTVRDSARVDASQILVGPGGTVVLDKGGLELATGIQLAGRLEGTGTIGGDVNNLGGTVSPGASAGNIRLTGGYTQDAAATFSVQLAGTGMGDYDVLDAVGAITLDGLLDLSLLGGFVPGPGDTFPILTSNTGVGGFFSNAPPGVPFVFADGQFDVLYGPMSVALANFSAPQTYEWNDPAGGTFGDPGKWAPPGPPQSFDHAVFNLGAGTYDVLFAADQTNSRLTIDNDDVAFRLAGHAYELAHPWDGDGSVEIGVTGGAIGRLGVSDGAVVSKECVLAKLAGSQGELIVGSGALWLATGSPVTVGDAGAGSLVVWGGQIECASGGAADDVGGRGHIDVIGVGSRWLVNGQFSVGVRGSADMAVRQGGLARMGRAVVGEHTGSDGFAAVDGAGSRWELIDTDESLIVGQDGNGMVVVRNDGFASVNGHLRVADNASSAGLVRVETGGQMDVGGSLSVSGGIDSHGRVEVDGRGSRLAINGRGATFPGDAVGMEIGQEWNGSLRITNGGYCYSLYSADIGAWAKGNSVGELVVEGNGSLLEADWRLYVGRHGDGNAVVRDGGSIHVKGSNPDPTLSGGGITYVGLQADGELTVTGEGSSLTANAQIHVGYGTFNNVTPGNGRVLISDGGTMTTYKGGSADTAGIIGSHSDGTGTVTVTDPNSKWLMPDGELKVGWSGDGTLNVAGGGAVESVGGIVAREPNSVGTATVTGSGSKWAVDDSLSIGGHSAGAGGTGTLHVNDGGLVTAGDTLAIWSGSAVHLGSGHVAIGAGAPPGDSNTVAVLTGGLLTGTGEVIGEVQNREGTVAPGFSFGTLQIDGDYLQGSQATLAVALDGNDNGAAMTARYDTLSVTGGVWLAGTLAMEWVQVSGDPSSRFGGSYDIITYGEARTGVFGDLGGGEIDANYVVAVDYDAVVDAVTHAVRITLAEPLGGDYDLDGDVDYDDYVLARDGFGAGPGAMWEDGDSDLNGVCDRLDYLALKRHFGQSIVGEAVLLGGAESIPAPATLLVLAAAVPALLRRRSRSRKRTT